MEDMGKHSANSDGAIKPVARRPGPPKGTPRPPGAGRKKGVPNRITRDVRAAAQKHGSKALKRIAQLIDDPDPRVALAAAREMVDRAYGRPVTPSEITGKDGAPLYDPGIDITTRAGALELARRVGFILSKGERALSKTIASGEAGDNVVAIPKGNRNAG